jgi:hypothetical protein
VAEQEDTLVVEVNQVQLYVLEPQDLVVQAAVEAEVILVVIARQTTRVGQVAEA